MRVSYDNWVYNRSNCIIVTSSLFNNNGSNTKFITGKYIINICQLDDYVSLSASGIAYNLNIKYVQGNNHGRLKNVDFKTVLLLLYLDGTLIICNDNGK